MVVGNHGVGGIEDGAGGAVVLLQPDRFGDVVVAQEVVHVADFRTAEGVDRLVVVTHGKQGGRGAGEAAQPLVLQAVGVLEFVDQDLVEARLVVGAQGFVAGQQLEARQQQLGKIHHAFAAALALVFAPDVDQPAVEGAGGLHAVRAQSLFLVAVDELHQLARWIGVVGQVERLQEPLDGGQLVLAVEDGEGGRQAGVAVVQAQKAVRQPVEGADPHHARIDRQHGADAGLHLAGGLVGEGDGQHAGRRGQAFAQQPGNAAGQHPGLAAAGSGEHQRVAAGRNGGELRRIEAGEEIGIHGGFTARQSADSTNFCLTPGDGGRLEFKQSFDA